jgi:hypothetical protein
MNLKKEIWKDIKNYEGLYQVSNLGRVKSLERITNIPYAKRIENERILKANKRRDGYLVCGLCKKNEVKQYTIHFLVAQAFLDKKDFKYKKGENISQINLKELQINHKDEIKTNNILENLEWCTRKYNCSYGTRNERVQKKSSKPVNQYDLNGNFIKTFQSINKAGASVNRCSGSIYSCLIGSSKQSGGYIWRWANESI